MGKRIVIALGGNALGNTPNEQKELVKQTAKAVANLVEAGNQVVIGHGNGPQVGMINLAFDTASKQTNNKIPYVELPECGAMSQGYIGYHLQNAIQNEFAKRNINQNVLSIVTQIEVDKNDPAFKKPSKPIGAFYSKEESEKLIKEKKWTMVEDAGRGYRQVVASPKPKAIVEIAAISELVEKNFIVISCGGGGIPVIKEKHSYQGVAAVIDKDFASAKLAEAIKADIFMVLTAVDRIMINYNKPDQKELIEVSIDELKQYAKEGHFAPGSMLPKVEAAISFVEKDKNNHAIIASLEKALQAIEGKTGTIVKQ